MVDEIPKIDCTFRKKLHLNTKNLLKNILKSAEYFGANKF